MAIKKRTRKSTHQNRNTLFEFIKNFWLLISGFIQAVLLFIGLIQKWNEISQIVIVSIGFLGLVALLLFLWWVAYRTKDNKFSYNQKHTNSNAYLYRSPQRKLARISFAIIVLSLFLGLAVMGLNFQYKEKIAQGKITILLATLDGPEETYGFTNKLNEELIAATKEFDEIKIITLPEVISPSQGGSEHAKKVGKEYKADFVVWGWYRPTENPNIVIHIENLSDKEFFVAKNNGTLQPVAKLSDLESFTVQQKVGGEISALVSFVAGMAWFQVGDYESAILRFDKALSYSEWTELLENKADAYTYRGLANYMNYDFNQAVKDYDKAINAQPDFSYPYLLRGAAYNDLENYSQAILDYDKAIALNSWDFIKTFAYALRALAYYNLGQFNEAITDYNRAIDLNPYFAANYDGRGVAYYGLRENQKAIDDYTQAILLDPSFSYSYANRGNSYDDLNQHDLALKDYNQAILLNPNDADFYFNRGLTYYRLSQYDSAIKDFDSAIALNPDYADAYAVRGNCIDYQGQHAQAIEDYNKAIKLNPDDSSVYFDRGIAYAALEQYNRAISDYSKAILLNPNYTDAYLYRSRIYEKVGNQSAASADKKKYQELKLMGLP